ncbi:MAG: hypothetical protein V2A76_16800 [Planctomycetota bacterium]
MADAGTTRGSPNYGGRLGYGIFYGLMRWFGVTPAYVLLAFVAPYYVLIRGKARRSAAPYLRHRFPDRGPVWRFFATILHFYRFGQVLVDQGSLGILGEEHFRIDFPGKQRFMRLAGRRRGVVVLGSHVGNWQSSMVRMPSLGVPVHFQFRLEEHTEGRHFFDLANSKDRFHFVSPDGFLGGMIELTHALQAGECVAMMGDRPFGAPVRQVPFLGEAAAFPVTPHHLAASTGADLVALLTVRTGKQAFRVRCVRLATGRPGRDLPRSERIERSLRRYVKFLERHVEESPFQWFNFFDFWRGGEQTPAP